MIRLSSSRSNLTSGPCMPSLLRISTCYLPKSGCRISCRSLLIFLLIRMSFLKSGRGRFVVIAIRCYFNPVTTSKVRTSHRVLELIARGHRRTWMKKDTITMRGSRNLSVKSPRTMRAARTRTSTQNKKSFKCTSKGMKILSRFNLDGQYDNNKDLRFKFWPSLILVQVGIVVSWSVVVRKGLMHVSFTIVFLSECEHIVEIFFAAQHTEKYARRVSSCSSTSSDAGATGKRRR